MATWIDEYQQMIQDCVQRESRLNEWEQGFVDSISRRLDDEKPLTPKQTETLDDIWERATKDG